MAEIERREVVVVGSGFGGAVTACRLAQAGCEVLVLERGRWYERGDFPRRVGDAWLWHEQQGPFDVHVADDVVVVRAAGVGGGSLLYSNVHLRMPADGFDGHWPAGWTREDLDPYYDLVAAMLELRTIDESTYWPSPDRTARMAEGAAVFGAERYVFHPPLAVNFGDPREVVLNAHGVEQSGCRHCGKCSVGCNHGAKNSLDKNYLPLAVRHGARIRARCQVTRIAAEQDGGYRVTFVDHVDGGVHRVVAETLVLGAGALGTTGLLLSHRDELGDLSPRLGDRYTTNGDVVSLAPGTDQEWRPTAGPAITAGILAVDEHWFLVEDGGVPPVDVHRHGVRSDSGDPPTPEVGVVDLVGVEGAGDLVDHTAILLGMGREPAPGHLEAGEGDAPVVDWSYRRNRSYYEEVARYHEDLGQALGAEFTVRGHRPTTVHSLGGAVMADDPERGVVDPDGQVFGAPGLYVVDGAGLPTATGVNPSHTIAAVAERHAEALARRLTGDPTWEAPEKATVPRHHDPLPAP